MCIRDSSHPTCSPSNPFLAKRRTSTGLSLSRPCTASRFGKGQRYRSAWRSIYSENEWKDENRNLVERTESIHRKRLGSDPVTDSNISDDPALTEILVTRDQIQDRVQGIAKQITDDYAGRTPLLIGVLKGGVIFAADLARAVDLPVELDFMAVSSYGSSTRNSGVVRIIKDLDGDIEGRDVIIVEDIVDSGLTLRYLRQTLLARNPASLEFCSLLVREEQQADLDDLVKYTGFRLPQVWVVGYGLDVGQRYRNLGDIWAYDTAAEH